MSTGPRPSTRPSSTSAPRSGPPAPSIPRPPLSVHPTATISETTYFQGRHPITIGAGTVIHPRARFLSFEGPINVGENCIIGEKSVIGGPDSPSTTPPLPVTIIENSVLIGPLVNIGSGSHVQSAATIDAAAVLGKRARIGRHAKICSLCEIPSDGSVEDWFVIWGGGSGMGLQKRKRANGRGNENGSPGLNGRSVESARLVVLNKERESLTKLIGASVAAAAAKRR